MLLGSRIAAVPGNPRAGEGVWNAAAWLPARMRSQGRVLPVVAGIGR